MSAPGLWLANFLAAEDACQFALQQYCKTKRGTKARQRWIELHGAIDARRRESLKWFREECARPSNNWDGCGPWSEAHQ